VVGDSLAHYNAHIADRIQVYPGVETALAALALAGWRQAVCTNKTARAAGLPVIAVGYGYTDVPVAELGPDRVISHFDEPKEACGALLGA
jgi:phosphoglycolate phosphatase-like HAD superfamily hydrolase